MSEVNEAEPKTQPTNMKKSRAVQKWIEAAKNIAEIVALIVGGWWAYSRFFATEAPSLEERGALESTLGWSQEEPDRCIATLGITIKNIGKRAFEVDSISL